MLLFLFCISWIVTTAQLTPIRGKTQLSHQCFYYGNK